MIEPTAAEVLMLAHNAGIISRATWGRIAKHVARDTHWNQQHHAVCVELCQRMENILFPEMPGAVRLRLLAAHEPQTMITLWQHVIRKRLRRSEVAALCSSADIGRAVRVLLVRAELRRESATT